jgi:CheY-like chemotaxis protein
MAQILLHDRGTTMLLVVDDEPGVRSVLLELLNLTVIPVALLRMVATHSIAWTRPMLPKAIILDLVMPVLDGWGFLSDEVRTQVSPVSR